MLCLVSLGGLAQLPTSNIYVFDLNNDFENDSLFLSKPRFLTIYNQNGYNNHPHFLSEEELMISSQTAFQDQPDLYHLDINSKVRTRVTDTPVGEYSPRRMPDYFNFSTVRMEFVQNDTLLRLWQFPLDRSSNGKPVFKDVTDIGYYTWLNSRDIVLYRVQSPNKLVKTDVYGSEEEVIAQNVGRCFVPMGGGTMLYVQNEANGQRTLMLYDSRAYFEDRKFRRVIETVNRGQDFAVLSDGTVLMADDSSIYKFRIGADEEWQKVTDLRAYNIKGISRIALSPSNGKIAVVSR